MELQQEPKPKIKPVIRLKPKIWKPITHDYHGREIEAHKHLTNFECCIDIDEVVHLRNKTRKKELKQTLDSCGYLRFEPHQGERTPIQVHRLVALLWKENPDNKPCVDHINHKDKLNNKLSNLRWCTKSENGMNRGLFSNNTSGESCIYEIFSRGYPYWEVQVKAKSKGKPLKKRFKRTSNVIPAEVIAWRDEAKKKHQGEFACIIPRPPSSESSAEP